MVGRNLIKYPHKVTTWPEDLITAKILWSSVGSIPNAKYVCANVKSFYLNMPMKHFEYMWMPIKLILKSFIDKYDLWHKTKDGFVYMEIRKGMYRLHAGILANQLLKKRLANCWYYKVPQSPSQWRHHTWPIQVTQLLMTLVSNRSTNKMQNITKCPQRPLQRGSWSDWLTVLWKHT